MSLLTSGGFRAACLFCLLVSSVSAYSQAGYELDLKKPAPFESKVLASEKSTTTKNTYLRRFVQGTVTHYNYYFNANQKLLQVIAQARASHKDDLTTLLSFYGYSVTETKSQKQQLDSVIYKCTAGIVLHDLRNGWIDNLYLLIGKAFFFETKFDSADRMLEFLNYHFYVHEEGDYHIAIGTNTQAQGGQISIVTPENNSVGHRAFNRPPSRNDGLIFQIRSYIEQGKFSQAYGLISLLKTDPLFPDRLEAPLAEQEAYWYYAQERWDSAAAYLEDALPSSIDDADRARREYLLAQLEERCHHPDAAIAWYDKVITHSTDPRLDIYARLYRALLAQGTSKDAIPQTIAALMRLAGKDRFTPFRDILYLSAARLALQEPDTAGAYHFLNMSVRAGGKGDIKNKANLMMAYLGLAQHNYKVVAMAYDSLQMNDPALKDSVAFLMKDRARYDKALAHILIVEREDSLQRVAALDSATRYAFVHNILRKLLKAQGLKEEAGAYGNYNASRDSNNSNLFGTGAGEWYFYNQSVRAQGEQDFEAKWGNRPNADNWRRQTALNASVSTNTIRGMTPEEGAKKGIIDKPQVLTMAALMANLPLTEKKRDLSNDTVAAHLYQLGIMYKNEIGDNEAAVVVLERVFNRYPTYQTESTLFSLYLCWHRIGDEAKAKYYLDLLHKRYPKSTYQVTQPAAPVKDTVAEAATVKYNEVYDQFIAGNYDTALMLKQQLDSQFGKKYWTPQLMYVQAVYYAHERQDSLAIQNLNALIGQFPKDPMVPKARKLSDVIHRRPMIETYLTNLKITRDKIDSVQIDTGAAAGTQPPLLTGPPDLRRQRLGSPPTLVPSPGALAEAIPASPVAVKGAGISGNHNDHYIFDAGASHYVIMVMTQVASVYSTEARTAFTRYNGDVHYQDSLSVDTIQLQVPGVNILRFGPFNNVIDALAYQTEIVRAAPKDIVPWLAAAKYQFYVITPDNLEVLRSRKDITEYAAFIASYLRNMPH